MTNLSLEPPQLEIQLKPGASYVQSYIVKNNGDQAVILNSSVDSWLPQGQSGNVTYLNSPPNLNISLSNSDLKLGQNFILNPNQSKQLVLKIQIPDNPTNNDHYFTFFINQDVSAIGVANSTQLIRLGSHLLVSVTDSEVAPAKFKVNNFKINNPIIDCFFSSPTFSGEFKNESDYFDKINDYVKVSKNGQEIKKIEIPAHNVLAHHSRQFTGLLSKPLWPGIYQASVSNQSITFIVLPYTLLIFLLLLIVIVKLLVVKKK